MMDGDGLLLARLDSLLVGTEMRAVLAEDPGLASLVENALRRARALLEARCVLDRHMSERLAVRPDLDGIRDSRPI